MASPGFTSYSVDNDQRFRLALDRAKAATKDLRIPFGLIAADFYRSQRAIFQLSSPGQYPDLSEAYKKRKRGRYGFLYPILKANGYLEAAASVRGGPGNITDIQPQELTLGVDGGTVKYAIYHQSDAPRSKIPLRKFLFIGPEAPSFAVGPLAGRPERWFNIMNEYVLQVLARSGVGKVQS